MSTPKTLHRLFALVIITGLLSLPLSGFAQEHPTEHPTEHPSHKAGTEISKETVAKAIEDYVASESELKGGYFLVYDEKAKEPLVLTLDFVHQDRLSRISRDTYFACADFNSTDGKVYDLDMFVKETAGELEIVEITVHKVDGKARYGWVEENGMWKRK